MVHGLLVTGPEENLILFNLAVCMLLNGIDRRGQTVRYTCMGEDLPTAVEAAKQADLTLQEIRHEESGEVYPVLHEGSHGMKWQRKERKPAP